MTRGRHASDEPADASQGISSDVQGLQDDASPAATVDRDLISRRAYERFQTRGGEHGHDEDDWLEAERQLNNGGRE
jgi:hypothetical protein